MPVQIKDLGIGKLKADIAHLKRLRITLGVQGREAEQTHPVAKVPIGVLALWLHAGTPDAPFPMPARPWTDRAIAAIRDTATERVSRAVSDLVDRRASDAVSALTPAAEAGLQVMTDSFDDARSWAEPLAESTIAAKGHDQPLLDTGAVRDAQSYAIRDGERIVKTQSAGERP